MAEYRERELTWFHNEIRTSERLQNAPFRILLMHQPRWGWLGGSDLSAARARWTTAANEAKVDLVIAGHTHRFSLTPAGGPRGNEYPILVVGQGDVARVEATENEIHVTVVAQDGTIRTEFSVSRRK
jgi:predicted phosphodiesterase